MRRASETITVFTHSEDETGQNASMLSLFDASEGTGDDVLLFAAHTPFITSAPTWAVLDETAVDELVEYLMVWKIRKKARDGG